MIAPWFGTSFDIHIRSWSAITRIRCALCSWGFRWHWKATSVRLTGITFNSRFIRVSCLKRPFCRIIAAVEVGRTKTEAKSKNAMRIAFMVGNLIVMLGREYSVFSWHV
ncbi:unnamed protein product [Sphenostylis stenocarpa]|uniref:Uncharacterized protein n=1 Tax=Sphenostylis stenocarpa TaxID=92480 RepID=A0AA86RKS7_9FABA|nr:unnamed protein product [Sphenostylis stenocarpa]